MSYSISIEEVFEIHLKLSSSSTISYPITSEACRASRNLPTNIKGSKLYFNTNENVKIGSESNSVSPNDVDS